MTTPLRHGPPRDSKARAVYRSRCPRPFAATSEAIPTGLPITGTREPMFSEFRYSSRVSYARTPRTRQRPPRIVYPVVYPSAFFPICSGRTIFKKPLGRGRKRNSAPNFVRSTPESGHVRRTSPCLLWPKADISHCLLRLPPTNYLRSSQPRNRCRLGGCRHAHVLRRLLRS
jgi:hypothetical protein